MFQTLLENIWNLFHTLKEKAQVIYTWVTDYLLPYFDTLVQKKHEFQIWYEATNATVWIIPSLMYVPILDFSLICLGVVLLGWYILKNLS